MASTEEIRLNQHLNLKASRTALYNPAYSKLTPRVGMLLGQAMKAIIPHLGLPPDIKVVVKPIRDKELQALACNPIGNKGQPWVEFDPRDCRQDSKDRDWDHYVYETVAHELVHIKQFLDGRLEYRYDEKLNTIRYWLGEEQKPRTTFKEYYNCPWEKEAREAEAPLRDLVLESIKNERKVTVTTENT